MQTDEIKQIPKHSQTNLYAPSLRNDLKTQPPKQKCRLKTFQTAFLT
ncbi:conserved hypothetical protein [Neisseria gonorrhoeae DGI2]|uniref:Uncharacterized protein n=1 Tax=Neisseria gonorrhoeae (strain NCCP11945) TaxID=521006 RepID=B4RKR6_NEIG2|nr:Hypothetical protein NGK_0726 [Neisseria gonorrhoeae NCCP11945]EFE04572.1 conserved hypothetical protein [Neisseria gonorrhoeae DGI2]